MSASIAALVQDAGAKYTDETIRENPYQSMAVAAGLGLLVGVLIGRRSK